MTPPSRPLREVRAPRRPRPMRPLRWLMGSVCVGVALGLVLVWVFTHN